MNVFRRVDDYKKNRAKVLSGKKLSIPFTGLEKIMKYVPGIVPGIMFKITSGSGAGKTTFAKFCFVYQTVIYAIRFNIDFKVIYFALEESQEEFIDGLFIHILKRKYGLLMDRFTLGGLSNSMVTAAELEIIEKAKFDVNKIMERIEVVDYIYEPTKMYEKCREIASKEGVFTSDKFGNEKYVKNNPDQLRLVVTDHISLVEEEFDKEKNKMIDTAAAMAKWHTAFQRKIITKRWGWTALNIQQQGLDSEKQVFTNKGETVVSKLLPTMDGLGDNRRIARDDYVIFGLFAPERFGISTHRGYGICDPSKACDPLYDNYRELILIKNRFGTPNKSLDLYFDGSYGMFKEMPTHKDPVVLNKFLKDNMK